MNQSSKLTEALDRCLTELQSAELSLDEAVRRFPGLAAQLRPLLLVAEAARAQAPVGGPSTAFRARSKARLMRRFEQRRAKTVRLGWLPQLRPAFALGAVLLVLFLLSGSVGVAYASDAALPGDALYSVKLRLEQLALSVTPGAAGDTRLLLLHADRRIEELRAMLDAGSPDQLGLAMAGYRSAVDQAIQLAASDGEQLEAVDEALSQHELALSAVLERAPAQAAPAIEAALGQAVHGQSVVEQVRSGGSPSELAPGQLKQSDGEAQESESLPPGKSKRENWESGELPPGQRRHDVCATEHPGRGTPKKCEDQ